MNKLVREVLPFGSLILVIAILSLWQPDSFLTVDNFLNVLRRSSVYGIIAVGMTFVIISGGIDLSVGSLLALCGMCAAGTMIGLGGEQPPVGMIALGTAVGLLTGAVGGLVSGALITKLKLQPFIATLGTMSLYRGIALVMYDGQPINVSSYRVPGRRHCARDTDFVGPVLGRHCLGGSHPAVHAIRSSHLCHRFQCGSRAPRGRESRPNSDRHLHSRRPAHRPRRDDRHEPNRLGATHRGRGRRARRHCRGGHRRCQPLRRPRNHHGNDRRHLAHQLLAQRMHPRGHLDRTLS